MKNNIVNKIAMLGLVILLALPTTAKAAISFKEPEYSEAYKQWISLPEEERAKYIEPIKYDFSFEDKKTYALQKANEKASRTKYSLAEDIQIDVKNQELTNLCWAEVAVTQLETNKSILTGKAAKALSSRHMEYGTSRFFANNEENKKGFNRAVGNGGNYMIAMAYLTSGQGAVLESDFPFENNENLIPLANLNRVKANTQLKDFEYVTDISKTYDDDGNVVYAEDELELQQKRNKIKEYIVNYGAINAATYVGSGQFFSTNDIYNNKNVAYYCNGADTNYLLGDHAISIIGWDDNYSKTNFKEGNQPKNDGAYIVQNSWGTEFGDNGIYYVSYDDFLIESQLMSITKTSDISYDKIYQYDNFGYNFATGEVGSNIYTANVFSRDAKKAEKLTEIGVYLPVDTTVDIYINTKGEERNIQNATYHQTENILPAGYHNIVLNTPQTLETGKFAVMVRTDSYASFEIYAKNAVSDIYSYIESNAGESYLSDDGITWQDMEQLKESGITGNACIKAFTTINFSQENATKLRNYQGQIYLLPNMTVEKIASLENFEIATRNDVIVTDEQGNQKAYTDKVNAGDKIVVKNKEGSTVYTYIVNLKGDINKDKQVKLYDAFKILETAILGSNITEEQNCIMDYNDDKNISLYDAFKFLEMAILG